MRRHDTGWRDSRLTNRHRLHGIEMPAPGMTLPMVEYDSGKPVGLINYIRRDRPLPTGNAVGVAYDALGNLCREDGRPLPFLTALYDPANWSFQLIGHNNAAAGLLDRDGWVAMSEAQFVTLLYRMRDRIPPDLAPYGVDFAHEHWLVSGNIDTPLPVESWPGASMSVRRRNYEPVMRVRPSWLNPCLDLDLIIPHASHSAGLLVDYKAPGAHIGLASTNVKALSSLHIPGRGGHHPLPVPAMVVRYEPDETSWRFSVHCANAAARSLLSYSLGASGADADLLGRAIAGSEWLDLDEAQWIRVLRDA